MAKILIVYATKHGQTEKIAFSIANELRSGSNVVDAFNSQYLPWDIKLKDYDAVIAGAPVYASGYPTHFKVCWLTPFWTYFLGALNEATKDSLQEIRDVSTESVTIAKNRLMESVEESPWYYLGGLAVATSLLGFYLGRKTKSSKREIS